jgi:hypothetical protein
VERLPGTNLVDISVIHTDPAEAAALANALANAYKNRRVATETSRSSNALDMINAQETLQAQKVETARQRMIELMEKFDIVDLGTQSNTVARSDTTDTGSSQSVLAANAALLEAKVEMSALKARIDTVLGFNRDMRLEWLRQNGKLSAHSAHVFEEKKNVELKLAMLKAEPAGGPQPKVTERDRELQVLQAALIDIDENQKRLMVGELTIIQKNFENMGQIFESVRDDAMKECKSYTQYVEARKSYESKSRILLEIREALMREKVDLSLPKIPIEMHEIAEADEVPVGQKTAEAIKHAAVTGLLWAIPGGLLLMYLAYARYGPRELECDYEDEVDDSIPDAEKVAASERENGKDSEPY